MRYLRMLSTSEGSTTADPSPEPATPPEPMARNKGPGHLNAACAGSQQPPQPVNWKYHQMQSLQYQNFASPDGAGPYHGVMMSRPPVSAPAVCCSGSGSAGFVPSASSPNTMQHPHPHPHPHQHPHAHHDTSPIPPYIYTIPHSQPQSHGNDGPYKTRLHSQPGMMPTGTPMHGLPLDASNSGIPMLGNYHLPASLQEQVVYTSSAGGSDGHGHGNGHGNPSAVPGGWGFVSSG